MKPVDARHDAGQRGEGVIDRDRTGPGRGPWPELLAQRGGDLVVGIVRRPDPVPCPNCAVGETAPGLRGS